MADFVAVLRKTLEGLGEPDPALRARVYDKARATISGKLAALDPPPPPGVAERQQRALEDAIATVERGYGQPAPAAADPLAELESVFASLKNPQPKPMTPQKRPAEAAPRAPETNARPREEIPPADDGPAVETFPPAAQQQPEQEVLPAQEQPDGEEPRYAASAASKASEPAHTVDQAARNDEHGAIDQRPAGQPRRRRGLGKFLAAAVVLAMLAGGAFGIWLNKDAFGDLLGLGGAETVQIASVPASGEPEAGASPAAPASTEPAEDLATAESASALEPATPETAGTAADASEPPAPTAAPVPEATGKFTQRLTPEGTETDPGRSGGESSVGEGTSVAALTQPPAATSPAAPRDAGDPPPDQAAAASGTDGQTSVPAASDAGGPAPSDSAAAGLQETAAAPAAAAIQVGQKAIFYEERTSAAEGSAEPGSIVWTLVQESPGGSLPPEPAIRAEATIPGKDVQLRMTIKRNADQSLPASHIIEMIFLTPEGFEGGGIENILRVAMKSSEQEAGNPLIGIPAKIADGFFLVALNDTKAEIDANLTLLRRQSWIDVPLVYKSGRRALLTMEKGIPGDKVFDEALKAWQAATAG